MTLRAGTRLGPYEVLAPVGAGGMGEVYRARDTRLDRTVAVKVLPAHLSASEEVRQRFEREARTISQLSHPHVCALYDVGNQDGVEYLVMEYLEGETLAERLVKGPLPLEQTLRFGIEIADALDKAHRQGIVHRDLKPGNVMLTKSGVKLLDFGLAKAAAPAGPSSMMTSLPTMTRTPLTQEGTILGTFQYMAPEQLEGKEADARSDIFAFGAVLYEMATGRKAFTGASQASLIGAILHTEPQPISSVQPMSPPALDRIVKTCLAKDPEDRFQTAHDVGLQLRWLVEGASAAGVPAPTAARRSGRRTLAAAVAGFAAGAVLAAVAVRAFFSPPPAPRQPSRFEIHTGAENGVFSAPWNPLAISPDGRMITAALLEAGTPHLFLHRFEKAGWTLIAGTDGATVPVFSHDGRWIAFQARGNIRKVPVSGGTPLVICEGGGASYGITWGADDTIWFGSPAGIARVPSGGGKPQVVIPVRSGELGLRRPQILPGGKALIFTTFSSGAPLSRIEAFSLETGRRKTLIEGGYQGTYSAATGHLLYLPTQVGGALVAVPFDPKRLEVVGPPVSVPEEAMTTLAVSDNGTLAYLAATGGQFNSMVWVDRSGKVQTLPSPPHVFEQPRISPDGRSVAVSSREGDLDIWIYSLERGTLLRFTSDPEEEETPIWSSDGKRITFRRGTTKILTKAADGSGTEELLLNSTLNLHLGSFTQDGRSLLLYALQPTGEDILRLSLGAKSEPVPWLRTPANEKAPTLSPNGKWIAYCSDESGREEIYVQAYPGPGEKIQISNEGGSEPVWSRNGRELFYRKGDALLAVDVTTEPSFSASASRVLFEGRFARGHRGYTNYDVSPDGTRFLMIQGKDSGSNPIHVVLDWASEFSRHGSAK